MNKFCSKCKEEKDINNFRLNKRRKDGHQSWCKECHSKREKQVWGNSKERRDKVLKENKNRRVRNKKFIYDYLSNHPCEKCGESNPIVLTFHHINPSNKKNDISALSCGCYSIKLITKEIEKCQVLCANCHCIETAIQNNYYDDFL